MSTSFDRQASCPSCGAPMTFRFAKSAAQVCKHCKFVVARTDRNLVAVGRVADLVDIPSPLQVGATGRWNGEPFVVDGRVQLDRAGAPGAPWQEIFIAFPDSGRWCWVATAQGRWYATSEVPLHAGLPHPGQLRAGMPLELPGYGTFSVVEVGHRRVVSGEGEMPSVAAPGAVTPFVDIAGPNGAFGTLDYGDGQQIPPKLYLGSQIDPAVMQLDAGGAPIGAASAEVQAVTCPNCGGNLPLATPETTERIICRYCGMASDLSHGELRALQPAPRPPIEPYVPLGAEGVLKQMPVICIGFVIRGCNVDGERYRWREYLLHAGTSVGYVWLMEEDNRWQIVFPISSGDVGSAGMGVSFRGATYTYKQSVQAEVEYVVGEFYWKVEIGESVRATEYEGPGGKVSAEQTDTEINHSFCEPIAGADIAAGFGLAAPPSPGLAAMGESAKSLLWVGLIALFIVCGLLGSCSDCEGGSSGGSGTFIGPGFGGK